MNSLAGIGAVLAYILLVDRRGFLLAASTLLFALVWVLGRRPLAAALVALVGTLVTHVSFAEFLLVPLPWGVLEPYFRVADVEVIGQALAVLPTQQTPLVLTLASLCRAPPRSARRFPISA